MTPLDHMSPAAATLNQIRYTQEHIGGDEYKTVKTKTMIKTVNTTTTMMPKNPYSEMKTMIQKMGIIKIVVRTMMMIVSQSASLDTQTMTTIILMMMI